MKKRGVVLLFGLIIIVSGWWVLRGSSLAQPSEGTIDVWVTWGDDSDPLQAFFDRYDPSSDVPVRVTTRIREDDVLKALTSAEPPDLVILSGADPAASYYEQGLVQPLAGHIDGSGIYLDDIFPAALAQCHEPGGALLCLPWGCDVEALFWNKDLFRSAGLDPERPPQTMEDMVEYAGKLTRRDEDGALSQVGFIPGFPRSHTGLLTHMFGGAFYQDGGAELNLSSQPVIEALSWQAQLNSIYNAEDLEGFVSSFTPYMASSHPVFAGRRLSCQQCHRTVPPPKKTPDTGFFGGKVAMMLDGQWQAAPQADSEGEPQVEYGVAAFPAPAAHPERVSTTIVQGPVVIIPTGAVDSEAAFQLLAWMTSAEIVAEAADAYGFLPPSRTALHDPRFRQDPNAKVFAGLLAHTNAATVATTGISQELNEALAQLEAEVLDKGNEPAALLNQVQAELGPRLGQIGGDGAQP
jgi:multiple sugar transport system substrate-binding protein